MGWGSHPSFCISERRLDFATAHNLFIHNPPRGERNYSRINISSARPSRSNYWLEYDNGVNPISNKHEARYRMRMYNTYIHTWWEDGTYASCYYDTTITRNVLSMFGPVHVWSNSRIRFCDKDRFGPWDGTHYPYGSGILVDPDGWIRDVKDEKYVLKPGARKERSIIRNAFRQIASGRVILGEFGDTFAKYKTNTNIGFGRWVTGWVAQVPGIHAIQSLYRGDDHETVQKYLDSGFMSDGPVRNTKELATIAAVGAMIDRMLDMAYNDWYERVDIPYGDINVNRL